MGNSCQDWPGLQLETRHPEGDDRGAAACWSEDVGWGTASARALWWGRTPLAQGPATRPVRQKPVITVGLGGHPECRPEAGVTEEWLSLQVQGLSLTLQCPPKPSAKSTVGSGQACLADMWTQ